MAREAGKPQLADDMAHALLRHFTALVAEDPVTMPGAAALVRLAARHIPLAVASNCPLDVVESTLARVGLLGHFAHVVVAGDGLLPKPHPDVYATAVRLCGVRPEDAMAVEDSVTGVESAWRAGMRVLGVGPRPAEEGLTRPTCGCALWPIRNSRHGPIPGRTRPPEACPVTDPEVDAVAVSGGDFRLSCPARTRLCRRAMPIPERSDGDARHPFGCAGRLLRRVAWRVTEPPGNRVHFLEEPKLLRAV